MLASLAVVGGAAGSEGVAGPVAAKGGVEDEVVVLEVGIPVAADAAPESGWWPPARGIGVAGQDIAGRGAVSPPPYADAKRGPLHSEDGTAVVVQSGSIERRVCIMEGAALVAVHCHIAVLTECW